MTEHGLPSARLACIFSMVPRCAFALDCGCDHAYIPIALVKEGICDRAAASDLREGPLRRAEKNIRAAGLSGRIRTVLADGLTGPEMDLLFAEEAGTDGILIVCGMGGLTILSILRGRGGVPDLFSRILLGPQSEEAALRAALHDLGFRIADERMTEEDGKYYPLILAERDRGSGTGPAYLTEQEAMYGPVLLSRRDEVFLRYLGKRHSRLLAVRESLRKAGKTEERIDRELAQLEEILRK